MTAGGGTVRLSSEGGIAWITLDRPERLNALAGAMRDELADRVRDAAADPEVRVIVVTGAGRAFCAGADLDAMARLLESGDEDDLMGFVEAGARVVREIRCARQPVIAGVNGAAAGAGASLLTACDLRVLSGSATIGFTFSRIGLHPDWGATHFLPRLIGAGRAAELIFSARMIDAAEAERIGLAQRVFPDPEFRERLAELASELAAKAPLALARAKSTLGAADAPLEEALRREAEAQLACFRGREVREGIAAFRERRSPRFTGA